MTIEEMLLKPVKTSRTWKKGEKFLKFRWMHQRYKSWWYEGDLPFMGRRYR